MVSKRFQAIQEAMAGAQKSVRSAKRRSEAASNGEVRIWLERGLWLFAFLAFSQLSLSLCLLRLFQRRPGRRRRVACSGHGRGLTISHDARAGLSSALLRQDVAEHFKDLIKMQDKELRSLRAEAELETNETFGHC